MRSHGSESTETGRWGTAWLGLCVAFAIHVLDEAVNDFLSVYNPVVLSIRQQFPWIPLATFTVAEWLSLLAGALVVLFSLALPVFRGKAFMRSLSYIFAVVMLGNGLLHVSGSLLRSTFLPGVFSSPVVLAAAAWLLVTIPRGGVTCPGK